MFKKVLLAFFVFALPVAVQAQALDSELIQKVVPTLQAQRNAALDAAAVSEGRIAILTEQLAKANEKIKSLEDKPKEAPKK